MPRTTSPAGTSTTTAASAPATASGPLAEAGADAAGPLPWEELVTSALLGTDRRPPAPRGGGSAPADAPAALLDAAVLVDATVV
ncbi:hypothetical protein ACFXGY_27830, partial [Streptomyces sp. NPDC059346]